jgi:AbrB family looped-hinge helix DNA binding protein
VNAWGRNYVRPSPPSPSSWHRVIPFALAKFQHIMAAMTAKLTMDKVGRIVLPKPVREKLQLAPGDELELESLDDRITLRPLRGTAQLRKKCGVWVFHCGEPLSASTVEETIEQVRRERDEGNLGPSH